jgi:hypothetical protein
MTTAADPALSAEQSERFERDGYVVLEGFFAADRNARLMAECDALHEGRAACAHAFELPEHGTLIADPGILAIAEQLLGPGFHFTHFGTVRMGAGTGAATWHHDLSQFPQSNRRHRQIGMLGYLSGLDGTIGDLVVLPGSHRQILSRDCLRRFGTATLPDEVVVRCGPGSLAVLDAAIVHARRPRPGGEGRWRYLLHDNYCQSGIRWPGQGTGWRAALERVHALGLDRAAHHGLIAPEVFFDPEEAERRVSEVSGSLVMG